MVMLENHPQARVARIAHELAKAILDDFRQQHKEGYGNHLDVQEHEEYVKEIKGAMDVIGGPSTSPRRKSGAFIDLLDAALKALESYNLDAHRAEDNGGYAWPKE